MTRQQVNDIVKILHHMNTMFTLIVEGKVTQEEKEEYLLQLKSVVSKVERDNEPAEITAKMVKELREQTGEGLMNCRRALTACKGDMAEAKEWMRKSGTLCI